MARAMCYVVTVTSAEAIEGKDRIHYVGFEENGYKVIASKENVHVGDKVVYFEVDSLCPGDDPRFDFLKARAFKESRNASLIRAMKMCNLRSQGLVMTFDELNIKPRKPGTDLTEELKIGKYEPEEDASPKMKTYKGIKGLMFKCKLTRKLAYKIWLPKKIQGEFPLHLIEKSDEDNIQTNKWMFDKYKNEPCYLSIKMEGQSVTVVSEVQMNKRSFFGKKGQVAYKVFGRNTIGQENHFKFFEARDIEKKLAKFIQLKHVKSVAVQGEYVSDGTSGKSVQSGIYKNGEHFYVYKVNIDGKTVDLADLKGMCDTLGLEHVPIIEVLNNGYGEKFKDITEMQEFTEHKWFKLREDPVGYYDDREDTSLPKKKNDKAHRHEGMVVCGINKGGWSFKVKSAEYAIEGL